MKKINATIHNANETNDETPLSENKSDGFSREISVLEVVIMK